MEHYMLILASEVLQEWLDTLCRSEICTSHMATVQHHHIHCFHPCFWHSITYKVHSWKQQASTWRHQHVLQTFWWALQYQRQSIIMVYFEQPILESWQNYYLWQGFFKFLQFHWENDRTWTIPWHKSFKFLPFSIHNNFPIWFNSV